MGKIKFYSMVIGFAIVGVISLIIGFTLLRIPQDYHHWRVYDLAILFPIILIAISIGLVYLTIGNKRNVTCPFCKSDITREYRKQCIEEFPKDPKNFTCRVCGRLTEPKEQESPHA